MNIFEKEDKVFNEQDVLHSWTNGFFAWYPFNPNSKILVLGLNCDNICIYLRKHKHTVDCKNTEEKYDYIILYGIIEKEKNPTQYLSEMKRKLSKLGTLLLIASNRMGLKNFCGDCDPYTGKVFDGIEGYSAYSEKQILQFSGRQYSKSELETFLEDAGFTYRNWFSIMPSMEIPRFIISEEFLPNERFDYRSLPTYYTPESIISYEKRIYKSLMDNSMFHSMSNAFLIECNTTYTTCDIDYVTMEMDRPKESVIITILQKNQVIKIPVYIEGNKTINKLLDSQTYFADHKIETVHGIKKDNKYIMPYIKAEILDIYMRKLAKENVNSFINLMDQLRETIYRSSEVVSVNEELGNIFKRCYIDMIPLNCFWYNEEFVFFDQEFYVENFPIDVVLLRSIIVIYGDDYEIQDILPKEFFYKRYNLENKMNKLVQNIETVLEKLINRGKIKTTNLKSIYEFIADNRQWLNEKNNNKHMH